MKKCREEIKQARLDRVLKPEERKVVVKAEKVAAERDPVPAVAQVKAEVKVKDKVKDKVEGKDKDKEEIAKKEVNIMPGFDRTGPQGAGPMTGGRRGRCNPSTSDIRPTYGRGFGYGAQQGGRLGLGRGFRRGASGMGRQIVGDDIGYPQSDPPLSMSENENILNGLKQGVDTLNRVLNELKDHLKTTRE